MSNDTPQLGVMTTEEALATFERLDAVPPDFMIGNWRGQGVETGHALDGLLDALHWRGKYFHSAESVHPLVFQGLGLKVWTINPALVSFGFGPLGKLAVVRSAFVAKLFQFLMPIMSTKKSRARLRTVDYKGQMTAAMVYDQLPIIDIFKRIDDDSVMGLMDHKHINQPFFFILKREEAAPQ